MFLLVLTNRTVNLANGVQILFFHIKPLGFLTAAKALLNVIIIMKQNKQQHSIGIMFSFINQSKPTTTCSNDHTTNQHP
jgi:hypothetical protein